MALSQSQWQVGMRIWNERVDLDLLGLVARNMQTSH